MEKQKAEIGKEEIRKQRPDDRGQRSGSAEMEGGRWESGTTH